MTTRLIINADDYGRSPEISRGIRFAHLNGLVTSSTCMMNMPGVTEGIKIAVQETPHLGLGVHLVLTAGHPLLPAGELPGLTDPAGRFLKQDILASQAAGLDPSIVKNEWKAQIESFITAAQKRPTHLDSHHHSSYFTAALFTAMLELAREYDLPIRLPIAHGRDPYSAGLTVTPLETKIDEALLKTLEKFQPRSPDAFFASFYDSGATRDEFVRILNSTFPNGTFEIMCHPGFVDEALLKESSYARQRQAELEILTDPAMRRQVENRGIELISFAAL